MKNKNKAYGLPYMGSKNKIAKWVVSVLPANDTLVDLFAGGCAVSHCAMLSGKYKRVIANDISDAPEIFADCVNGKIDISRFPLTRDEFKSSTDTLARLLYSFSNNMSTYIYGKDREEVCVAAERMIYGATIDERYAAYKKFTVAFSRYLQCAGIFDVNVSEINKAVEKINHAHGLERVNRCLDIASMRAAAVLETSRRDYRDFDVPANSTVYVDPPYKGTVVGQYKVDFDYDAFENWLDEVDFPVFVSEYTCPKGCVEIARKDTVSHVFKLASRRVERIFVQERFYDSVMAGGRGEE